MKSEWYLFQKRIDVSSQSRRRALVVWMYVGFAAVLGVWFSGHAKSSITLLPVLLFLFAVSSIGGRTSAKEGILTPFSQTDERESIERDRAHYVAYRYVGLMLLLWLASEVLKDRVSLLQASWPTVRAFLEALPSVLYIATGVIYLTLPQAIILWSVPTLDSASTEDLERDLSRNC
jgi:hypothetical protein